MKPTPKLVAILWNFDAKTKRKLNRIPIKVLPSLLSSLNIALGYAALGQGHSRALIRLIKGDYEKIAGKINKEHF